MSRRRRHSGADRIGAGGDCPSCGKPMERRSHPATWRPKMGQPFYYEFWDVCVDCRRTQHFESAKVWIDVPEDQRPAAGAVAEPGSPLSDARRAARIAVNAHLKGCSGRRFREFVADLLGIEEKFASINLMDETECRSIIERIADLETKKPAGGVPAG